MPTRKRLNGMANGAANGAATDDTPTPNAARREKRRRRQVALKSRAARKRKGQLQQVRGKSTVLEQLSSGDFPNTKPVEALCKLGLSDAEVADVLGVKKKTFLRWLTMSPSLRAATQRGRRVADTHVAESLYMQAIGFSAPEEKVFYNSQRNIVVRAQTNRYYPPNALAGIFWLKNRYADYWRDKKEIEVESARQIQEVKFVLVVGQGGRADGSVGGKVIDADYRILPGAGDEGRELATVEKHSGEE